MPIKQRNKFSISICMSLTLALFTNPIVNAAETAIPSLPFDTPTNTHTTSDDFRTSSEFTTDRGVSFMVDDQGAMIPVAADGTPFATCGTLDDNTCSLFKKGITINKMERINITKIEHQINPTCLLYIINVRGVDYIWYDKTDKNCAKFNK